MADPSALEALVDALAVNIYRAYMATTMGAGHVPKLKEEFERITHPVPGDLVLEVSSRRRDPHRIGILLEVIENPAYTPEQWAEYLAGEREQIARYAEGDRSDRLGFEEFMLARGPRFPETTPIPNETSYLIEPFLGDDETVTWGNARFVAGFLTEHEGQDPSAKLSRASLRVLA